MKAPPGVGTGMSIGVEPGRPVWVVIRHDHAGAPHAVICHVEGIRLQIFRHVAFPGRWVAYACGVLQDLLLQATTLESAQEEALEQLHSRTRIAIVAPCQCVTSAEGDRPVALELHVHGDDAEALVAPYA